MLSSDFVKVTLNQTADNYCIAAASCLSSSSNQLVTNCSGLLTNLPGDSSVCIMISNDQQKSLDATVDYSFDEPTTSRPAPSSTGLSKANIAIIATFCGVIVMALILIVVFKVMKKRQRHKPTPLVLGNAQPQGFVAQLTPITERWSMENENEVTAIVPSSLAANAAYAPMVASTVPADSNLRTGGSPMQEIDFVRSSVDGNAGYPSGVVYEEPEYTTMSAVPVPSSSHSDLSQAETVHES